MSKEQSDGVFTTDGTSLFVISNKLKFKTKLHDLRSVGGK